MVPTDIMVAGYTSHNHVKEEYDDSDFIYMNRLLDILYNKEDMNLYMKFSHTQNYILIPDAGDFSNIDNCNFYEKSDDLSLEDLETQKICEDNIIPTKVVVKKNPNSNLRKKNKNATNTKLWLIRKHYTTLINELKFINKHKLNPTEINTEIEKLTTQMNNEINVIEQDVLINGIDEQKYQSINTKKNIVNTVNEDNMTKVDTDGNIIGNKNGTELYDDSTILMDYESIVNMINDQEIIVEKKIFHQNHENKIMEKYLKNLRSKKILSDIVKLNLTQQINICLQSILDLPRFSNPIKVFLDIKLKNEHADTRITHFIRARLYPCVNDLQLNPDGSCDSLFQFTIPANFPVYMTVPHENPMLTTFYLPYSTIRAGNKWNIVIKRQIQERKNVEINAYQWNDDKDETIMQKVLVKRIKQLFIGPVPEKINNITPINQEDNIGNIITELHERISKNGTSIDIDTYLHPNVFTHLKHYGMTGWNIRYLSDHDLNIIETKFGTDSIKKITFIRDLFIFYKSHVPMLL